MVKLETIFAELAELGICKSGVRLWNMSPKDMNAFISFWKRWPEYMVEHGYEALKIIRTYFSNEVDLEILAKNGIYVDQRISDSLDFGTILLLGSSTGQITIKPFGCLKIYAYHDVALDIICEDSSYVNIETYQKAKINVVSESARCTGYVYDDSDIKGQGTVLIEHKEYMRGEVFNGKEVDYESRLHI